MSADDARARVDAPVAPVAPATKLPAAVVLLGVTSLFTDAGSEMIFPLLPAFLTGVLGASPAFLGLVEGIAETVASLLKLASGYAADRRVSKKGMVVTGYALASSVRPLVAVATAPWHVLAVRATDRVGKGLRSSPRDAIIADAAGDRAGRAFGFHRAMDHAGAVIGPLVATGLLAAGVTLRHVFALAVVPGAFALGAVLLVRAPAVTTPIASEAAPDAAPLPARFRVYLVLLATFALANSSDAFLLLRARDLGVPLAAVPVLWTVLHIAKLVSAYGFGALSDRVGRAPLVIVGWLVYAAAYVGLALATTQGLAWALFVVYGLYYGLTEPTEKALVRELVPASARGRAFGLYNFTVGVCTLPASLLTGWVWTRYGASRALEAGAAVALVAAVGLGAWARARSRA